MAFTKWQATIQDDAGNLVPSPVVTVRNSEDDTLAAIYGLDGVTIANPITGDLNGFVQFQVYSGRYYAEGVKSGSNTEDQYFETDSRFDFRSELVEAISDGWNPRGGFIVSVGDLSWQKIPAGHSLYGANPISDMPGWGAMGDVYLDHFIENISPGVTPMQDALTEAWSNYNVVNLRADTYAFDGVANSNSSTKALIGKSHQATIIEVLHSSGDVINFNSPSVQISDILISNLTIRGTYGVTRTSGAHVRFEKPVARFYTRGVRFQNYFDGISGPEFNACYLVSCWWSQFGIASGGKGGYSINNDRTVALSGAGAVDFHIIGCQFSGLNAASGSNQSGLIAHFRTNSCDGVYITGGTHMFYADYALLFDPDGATSTNHNKIASVQASGCYLDSAFISQVKMTGNTSQSVYREFTFSNTQFRDAMAGPAIELDAPVGRFTVTGGSKFRNAYAEAIKATDTGVYELIVSDSHFEDNNLGDVSGVSDIDFDGSVAVISDVVFSNTRSSGRAIRMRSSASDYDLSTINTANHANTTDPILLDSADGYVDGVQKVNTLNGWYEKYKDGRLVCHRVADIDVTSTGQQVFALPHNFVDREEVSSGYSHMTGSVNSALYRNNISRFGATETAWFAYLISAGTSSAPGTTAEQIALKAEGTWK